MTLNIKEILFESCVVLDGGQTGQLEVVPEEAFESCVVLDGSLNTPAIWRKTIALRMRRSVVLHTIDWGGAEFGRPQGAQIKQLKGLDKLIYPSLLAAQGRPEGRSPRRRI